MKKAAAAAANPSTFSPVLPELAELFFGLLDIKPSFNIDPKELEKHYFEKQRLYHPDRFIGKPPAERNAALQKSADINEAFKALKTSLTRAQTLLAMEGVLVGTDKDTTKPSSSLLMETLEWRESIDEAATLGALKTVEIPIDAAHSHCLSQISALYAEANWPEMAQATLRLGYLEKALEAIGQKKTRLEKQ
jgi:molecular chaperone HscB